MSWKKSLLLAGIILTLSVVGYLFFDSEDSVEKISLSNDTPPDGYNIVFLGASQTIKLAFDGFKTKMDALAEDGGVNINYTNLDIPFSESSLQDAVKYILESQPDLVVTGQSEVVYLAKRVSSIPIINVLATDVVKRGLAKSEEGSGNNIVFVETGASESSGRRLEFFLELMPKAKNILVVRSSKAMHAESGLPMEIIQKIAKEKGVNLIEKKFENKASLEEFLKTYDFSSIDAVFRYPSYFIASNINLFEKYKDRINKPFIVINREELEKIGILAYSPRYGELGEIGATIGWQILKGQVAPGDVPIQHPFRNEFGINEKIAKSLGIEIPNTLREKADYIITDK